ncbi:sugar isomerase (plasmid) [Arthrobacter sp. ERGS1:01]|nr:sugar isomerase [Arthrobacter sp. ERGS1:01]
MHHPRSERHKVVAISEISRRTLFRAAGSAAVAGILLGQAAGTGFAATPASMAELITRRRAILTGGIDASTVPELAGQLAQIVATTSTTWASMDKSAGRTGLWADIPLTGIGQSADATSNMALQFNRLFDLAMGHAVPGTAQTGDPQLAADIVSGLQLLSDTAYKPGMKAAGNWWFWEIGNPRKVVDILTLMYDVVPAPLRSSLLAAARWFAPNPNWRGRATSLAETGANRVDKSLACAMRGILDGNAGDVAMGRDALSDVVGRGKNSLFAQVTSGDGFYQDGSFIQHGTLPYAGTYGVIAFAGVAEIINMVGGSSWEVTDPARATLLDAVENTFAPFVWDGRIMDTIRGRAVSRQAEPDYVDGFALIGAVLLMAPGAGEPYTSRFLALAKGWLQRCTDQAMVGHPTQRLAKSLLALDVLNNASVTAAPSPVYTRMFADQDRLVHHRPAWGSTVSTSSNRVGRYEWGNDENNFGWYQGDGMTYVYNRTDRAQFSSDFWPTVDPYRLPGTTVNLTPRPTGSSGAGTGIPGAFQPFAGGLSVEARWGVVGMDHLNYNKSLAAKKSWFFLDDTLVCLGAGITGTGGAEVLTTLENRSYATGQTPDVRIDHANVRLAAGASRTASGSIHVEGYAGFVLLPSENGTAEAVVSVVRRTGNWRAINSGADTGGKDAPVTRDYVTITASHGTDPVNQGYAYMVLPAAEHSDTFKNQAKPRVTVLANTKDSQLLSVPGESLTLGNFYAASSARGFTASGPCSVAVHEDGRELSVTVADPSRTQATVRLTVPGTGKEWSGIAAADPGVTVVSTKPLTLEFSLAGNHGHQKAITLKR